MTQLEMFPTAISSQRDIPVSLSASPVSAADRRMIATSGRTSCGLLHPKDPLGAFSRMFMATSHWGSTKCCLTWKSKATPRGRLLFQLAVSMRPTSEIEFGSSPKIWPTPNASNVKGAYQDMTKLSEREKAGRQRNLQDVVRMWPTPRSCTAMSAPNIQNRVNDKNPNLESIVARSLWPTPTTQDAKNNGGPSQHNRNTKPLNAEVGGSLNPEWVEWLMGYPEGWTDLKD